MPTLTRERTTAMDRFQEHLAAYFEGNKALSIRALAKNSGVSHVYLLKLLRRESVPTLDVAERIAAATGTSLSKILQSA